MRLRRPTSRARKPSERAAAAARRRDAPKSTKLLPAGRREALAAKYGPTAARTGSAARRSGVELVGIGREMVRLPAAIYMRVAEVAGGWVLRVWLILLPFLVAALKAARSLLAIAQREVTPARMGVAVALAACVALAGSQWSELREIAVGTDAYIDVEAVAPPPAVEAAGQSVGSAHGFIGLPLAIVGALAAVLAARGRPRLALLLAPIGIAVVAISLMIDRPEGLDEGVLAIQYESVTATLLDGFWAQLVSGVVLILLAPVLTRILQAGPAGDPRRGARRRERAADPADPTPNDKPRREIRRPAEAGQ